MITHRMLHKASAVRPSGSQVSTGQRVPHVCMLASGKALFLCRDFFLGMLLLAEMAEWLGRKVTGCCDSLH